MNFTVIQSIVAGDISVSNKVADQPTLAQLN